MFSFWGRRGALSQFVLECARASTTMTGLAATFSVSRQNECFSEIEKLGIDLAAIDTFSTAAGAVFGLWRIPGLRRELRARIERDRIEAMIELMPHVWSPLLTPALKNSGIRYCPIIHDAVAHPGDPTARAKPLLDLTLRSADRILTLSEAVAKSLRSSGRVAPERVRVLFHPDLTYATASPRIPPAPETPFRIIFLGRILPYKGLPLFVEAIERLRARGLRIEVGVYGEGSLGLEAARLGALGAQIVNHWLSGEEISQALAGAHVVAISHIEASQSGVVAAAHGAGLPVVVTPVGGLVEQVHDGKTGLLSRDVSGEALADAMERLITEPGLYQYMLDAIYSAGESRSMKRFLMAAVSAALD